MPTITLVLPNEIEKHDYEVGQNLLQIVRGHEHDISAPCGGNGTCGKCKIKVKGHGIVTSRITSYNVCYTKLLRMIAFVCDLPNVTKNGSMIFNCSGGKYRNWQASTNGFVSLR